MRAALPMRLLVLALLRSVGGLLGLPRLDDLVKVLMERNWFGVVPSLLEKVCYLGHIDGY